MNMIGIGRGINYDSDKTGNEHAMKMLQEGYNVFMWGKLKKDLGLPDKNPYSSNKLKWDIYALC